VDDTQGQVWGDNAVHATALHPLFAARVEGLDLRQPLTAEQARWVEARMDEYAVLVFPGQNLTDEQQIAFGENFGPLEGETATVDVHRRRLAHARMNDISNLDENGALLAADDRRRFFALGNRLWHSDSSFKRVPAKYSALHGRVVPAQGADTEFADMRAAWDALPSEMQAMTRDLICDHSLIYSRALLGFEDYTAEERVKFAPVPQRLVRRHPGSGRQTIYLSAHIGQIQGWPRPEAMMLIRDLMEHATQRQFVYRHKWAQHDLVLWDNRCTMHRGTRFDDKAEVRDMRRVTLSDRASSLEQAV
jgi:alpha-ketoglutarate-dependent 2,4-dichlorophenoxyacetate dioxygenase